MFISSCANAKKWEIELATLKNNNIRLTSALQVNLFDYFPLFLVRISVRLSSTSLNLLLKSL